MKISVISGGFDPIHSGHIEYIKSAASYSEKLVVCLNSDDWLIKKKGRYFLPFEERKAILENINQVDEVISFEDDDKGSCINGLRKVQEMFPSSEIVFCNGGDRNESNIPEMEVSGISFNFGTGGNNKKNSSSWILKNWQYTNEKRQWGEFFNLFQDSFVKVKELVIAPHKSLSFQRHFKRNEIWFVSHGKCEVNFSKSEPSHFKSIILNREDHFFVDIEMWHQICNPFNEECRIIEIQFGDETVEDDIQRIPFKK